jgi:hypothetical protein
MKNWIINAARLCHLQNENVANYTPDRLLCPDCTAPDNPDKSMVPPSEMGSGWERLFSLPEPGSSQRQLTTSGENNGDHLFTAASKTGVPRLLPSQRQCLPNEGVIPV